ncbi:hypothetical protein [Sorangium cellulosum]|uniref:hypothetical protein n=1 Tax=Sorangium cellulosum TaxID=56 RepID=UPI0010130B54|nr:hypothetical protein [Sorangium cellulosum]
MAAEPGSPLSPAERTGARPVGSSAGFGGPSPRHGARPTPSRPPSTRPASPTARSPDALATVPAGDAASLRHLEAALRSPPRRIALTAVSAAHEGDGETAPPPPGRTTMKST